MKRLIKTGLGTVAAALALATVAGRVGKRGSGLSSFRQAFDELAYRLDHSSRWDKFPLPVSLLVLIGMRDRLRQKNLYDVSPPLSNERIPSPTGDARYMVARTVDGTYNDLQYPTMGSAGTRFGRNIPLEHVRREPEPAFMTPNPRTVSLELLTRDTFKPATTLNVLAAAWLQFMTRDWFSHGRAERDNPWKVPLKDGDPWHENPMQIERLRQDPTRTPEDDAAGLPPTSVNVETHWWDASQVYGSDKRFQSLIRTGVDGKVIMGEDGVIHMPDAFLIELGSVAGWWLGLAMMHTLFMHEHNAICDRLKAEYPNWSDDDLFDHARLINAALLAKIHTVEWTPAILDHPALHISMRANWWGVATERVYNLIGRISDNEILCGIVGSKQNHHDVPFSITEEFISVYRMHPLIPDDYEFRSARTGALRETLDLTSIAGLKTQAVLERIGMPDLLYSFGVANPGALVLHNFPRGLQRLERPDGKIVDMAALDILRIREIGEPRYNAFRRLMHLPPVNSFEELTSNPTWREELRRVYNDDIEQVDLMIGLYAEEKPAGFGLSDTAFRIFVIMASRRLNCDRFFTTDFNARVYTQVGLDWIANNDMSSVLLRHYPQLRPALKDVKNAFAPWPRIEV